MVPTRDLDLTRRVTDVAIEARRAGAGRPVHISLIDDERRWTVLVFEPDPDGRRLREIADLRTNFAAEDAALVVVTPPRSLECLEAEFAGTGLDAAIDGGELAATLGTSGAAAVVVDGDGYVVLTAPGRRGEVSALWMLGAAREGLPL